VTHYTGSDPVEELGEWTGYLTYKTGVHGVKARFDGLLAATPGATTHTDPLELFVSVSDDDAWAGLAGKGMEPGWSEDLPLVDPTDGDGLVSAPIDSGDGDHRFYFFGYPTYSFGG
jgi:hypothetical protein